MERSLAMFRVGPSRDAPQGRQHKEVEAHDAAHGVAGEPEHEHAPWGRGGGGVPLFYRSFQGRKRQGLARLHEHLNARVRGNIGVTLQ